MADLPITSDQGAMPVVINDPVTAANIAHVNVTNELLVEDGDLELAQGSTTSGQVGPLVQGAVTTGAPVYVTAQTSPLSLDTSGNLRVTVGGAGTQVVTGNKTNNNAAPGATNVGVLSALANAASPSWTEGDLVLESVDLTGRQRIRGTLTNNNAAPAADQISVIPSLANAANPTWTEGNQVLLSSDLSGNLRTRAASAASATVTRVAVGHTSAATLLAARSARIRVIIFNENGQLFVKAGSTATTIDYTWNIGPDTVLDIEGYYTGILTAIAQAGTSNVQVTDF
jgi:hypothetical protein